MSDVTPRTTNQLRTLSIVAAVVLLLMAVGVTVGGILLTNAHRDATGLIVLGAGTLVPTALLFANYGLGIRTHAAATTAADALNGNFEIRVMSALEKVLRGHLGGDSQ